MTPADKVAHGLTLAGEGIAELRILDEQLAAQREACRASLVGGEEHARALRWQAHRSRRPRHLLPGEVSRPAPPLYDGLRADAPELDARTALGLRTAALVPTARAAPTARRTWAERLFGGPSPEPLCPSCLHTPCLCSPRLLAPTEPLVPPSLTR